MEITDRLYGKLAGDDVREAIFGMEQNSSTLDEEELFRQFMEFQNWRKGRGQSKARV